MITCNTTTGAVSHYTRHEFQSITPTHAGSATGLFAFGGDKDIDQPIVSEIRLPKTLRKDTLKKYLQAVYASVTATGSLQVRVFGKTQDWQYPMVVRESGQSRCEPGRGIRENYLGIGLSNPAGQPFSLDRIEVLEATSKTRRV